jgi:hypothetical protein
VAESGGIKIILITDPFTAGTKLKSGKVDVYFYV